MKLWVLLTVVCLFTSCDPDYHSDFCDAVVHYDVNYVRDYIDDILEDLEPYADFNDPLGHLQNLETLVFEINRDRCADAIIACYACIETFPLQSELHLIIDDGHYYHETFIDIATPAGSRMYFVGMHP